MVRQSSGTFKHFALLVRPIFDGDTLSNGLRMFFRVRNAHEVSVREHIHAVTSGADLSIHFEATSHTGFVKGTEGPFVIPWVVRWMEDIVTGSRNANGHDCTADRTGSSQCAEPS